MPRSCSEYWKVIQALLVYVSKGDTTPILDSLVLTAEEFHSYMEFSTFPEGCFF